MDSYKKGNIVLFTIAGVTAMAVWYYWQANCTQGNCTWELRNFTVRPLLWGGIALTIITGTLVLFPSFIFKQWLRYIFSWGLPLTLYTILVTDPSSSNILSFDRGQVAWLWGIAFFTLTVLQIICTYGYRMYKKDLQGLVPAHLLFLVPFIVTFYLTTTYYL